MKGARPLRSTRRMSNLGQRPGWFTVTNKADEATGPIVAHIYDEIGMWGVSAQDFMSELQAHDGDLELHINSPGGDIFDGIAIYNVMKQRSGLVSVIIDGLAASAASFIAQAASEGQLFISPHAQMMIHDGFAMAIGNAKDMRETADLLDKASDNIATIYAERTGRDASYWRNLMRAETWFSDQEAVDAGLADAIHGKHGEPVNSWNLGVFNHFMAAGSTSHAPFHGVHTHNHISYGAPAKPTNAASDDDGDEYHEHEHAHGNARDGAPDDCPPDADHRHHEDSGNGDGQSANSLHQLILNAAVDESSWDRDRAMHEAAQSDSPAKAYAKICAGRRSGPANEGQNWALPHHYPDKDAPNAAGVRNALARLSSTQGLTNADGAKAHLQAHMRAINPDWEPDDHDDFGLMMSDLQEAIQQ